MPRRAVAAALELHAAIERLIADAGAGARPPRPQHAHRHQHRPRRRPPQRCPRRRLRPDRRHGEHRRPAAQPGGAGRGRRRRRHLAAGVRPLRGRGVRAGRGQGQGAPALALSHPRRPDGLGGRRRPARRPGGGAARLRGRGGRPAPNGSASRVVVVRGDPGVGKSRLVAEFAARAQALGFSCHAAAVLDFGAETGRDAIRSLARSLLGVAGAVEPAERAAAIEAAAAARPIATDHQLFLYDLLDVTPPPALRALAAAMSTAAARAGLAARRVRARHRRRSVCRPSSCWSRTCTGRTPGRSSASPRSPCSPRSSPCCW